MERGHVPLAELAISVGADIYKAYDGEGGITYNSHQNPPEWAALYGHSDVIQSCSSTALDLILEKAFRRSPGHFT